MLSPTDARIARRLKALREERSLKQEALAALMGLPHRQSLTSIEAGERSVSAEELAKAAAALEVDVGAFTDPFQLIGEGEFSFRADDVPTPVLDDFEDRVGGWVATYRTLLDRAGVPRSHMSCVLQLRSNSSFEDTHAAAEELRHEWKMGDAPASVLCGVIEREMGIRVLFVDAPKRISGAAVRLPGLPTIIVNRREPAGRRNFDIAHELFHLLTWDAMRPERVEPSDVPKRKGNRVEWLAENFAGALLMPADVVRRRWEQRGTADVRDWLLSVAPSLHVTAVALKWRLVVLGLITKREADSIDDRRLASNASRDEAPPLLFDREFITRVHEAVEQGYLSLRRATGILGTTARDFSELCGAYGLTLSYEV